MTLRGSRRNYSCIGFISNTIFTYEATSQAFFRVFRFASLVGVCKSQQPTAPVCHIKSPAQAVFTSTGWLFRLRDGPYCESLPELFAGQEMGEDTLRVLHESLSLRARILADIAAELPRVRAAVKWAVPFTKYGTK